MSHDQPTSSSVRLLTETYLRELPPADLQSQQIPSASKPSTLEAAWPVLRLIPAAILGVAILAVGVQAMSAYDKEKGRRVCGVDWLLWAGGSDQTFESILTNKLEDSRREFERQMEESRSKTKPFDFKPLATKSLQWNPQQWNPNGMNPQFGQRK